MRNRGAAVGDADLLTIDPDVALPAARPDTKQTLHRFGSARAHQPGDAEDFTASQRKRDVVDATDMAVDGMPGGEVFHLQHRVADLMRCMRIERGQLATDHHGDDVIFAHARRRTGGNVLTVADDADGVGDRLHLIQLVRNVDTGDAVFTQIADDTEQHLRLLLGQGGGRLIQNQQPDLFVKGAGNLHQLLLAQT